MYLYPMYQNPFAALSFRIRPGHMCYTMYVTIQPQMNHIILLMTMKEDLNTIIAKLHISQLPYLWKTLLTLPLHTQKCPLRHENHST